MRIETSLSIDSTALIVVFLIFFEQKYIFSMSVNAETIFYFYHPFSLSTPVVFNNITITFGF